MGLVRERARQFAGALLALAASAPVAIAAADWSSTDLDRLRRGEAVVRIVDTHGPGGRLRAAIDIPRPPSTVWKVMLDCARAPAYVPGLKSCRVLETAPDGASDVREHKMSWIAILPSLTVRFRSEYTAEREIRVHRVSGDLAVMDGQWRLEPLADGRATRLHYDFRIVPQAPVPAGLIRAGLVRDTPRVLEAVRAEAARVAPM